ncbi:MAG: hypothetical protein KatS3mg082_0845 [Nitrospiraceae bacterium]|jgi:hypothetical protein|nr:MAG: hypothetical protein KatS3mg082_0845 [Nitrospiraceae bacterium]
MAATLSRMTKDELKELIEATVERKLRDLLGDPDEGLVLKKAIRERLRRQKRAVAAGQRGESFAEVARRLGLDT